MEDGVRAEKDKEKYNESNLEHIEFEVTTGHSDKYWLNESGAQERLELGRFLSLPWNSRLWERANFYLSIQSHSLMLTFRCWSWDSIDHISALPATSFLGSANKGRLRG